MSIVFDLAEKQLVLLSYFVVFEERETLLHGS